MVHNDLAEVVGPCWSEARVLSSLGATVETVSSWIEAGAIHALTTADGDRLYPVAQFQRRGGVVEVKPGLRPVFEALRDFHPWTVAVLLHTAAPELDDATPSTGSQWGRTRTASSPRQDSGT